MISGVARRRLGRAMNPAEQIHELERLAKLVCEIEVLAHYQIVKAEELRAQIAEMERRLQQVKRIKGGC